MIVVWTRNMTRNSYWGRPEIFLSKCQYYTGYVWQREHHLVMVSLCQKSPLWKPLNEHRTIVSTPLIEYPDSILESHNKSTVGDGVNWLTSSNTPIVTLKQILMQTWTAISWRTRSPTAATTLSSSWSCSWSKAACMLLGSCGVSGWLFSSQELARWYCTSTRQAPTTMSSHILREPLSFI